MGLVCVNNRYYSVCIAAVTDTDYIDATSVWLHSFTFLFKLESKLLQLFFSKINQHTHTHTQTHMYTQIALHQHNHAFAQYLD